LDAQTLNEKPNNPWCASPFIRVDEELKVSLLFLLRELRTDPSARCFKGDYHRFAAESQPVQKEVVPRALVEDWIPTLPPPTKSTITSSQSDPSAPVQSDERTPSQPSAVALSAEVPAEDIRTLSDHQLRRVGDEAFRVRDYKRAVDAFNLLAERHGASSEYNDVAKSKHGGSLWRIAAQESMGSDGKKELIRRAVDLLEQASSHRDPQYRARAHYEKSKALWHLWRLLDDVSYLQQARDVASEAARLQNEPSFVSWYEKVTDDLEWSAPSRTGAG
jgi:hypothetical protein